jgi:glycosyltransferase involved in cell wall biosynthesis
MPVYGVEKFLENSINCVLNQTFTDFELILVDDKSPDNCPAICDAYAQKDNRIRVIHLEQNGGLGNARNNGMDSATGKYILFLDSDDTFDKDMLENAVHSINENPAQVVLFGMLEEYYDKDGTLCKTAAISYPAKCLPNTQKVRNEIIALEESTLYGYATNKLYLLEHLRKHNCRFTKIRFNEDIIFNIDVFMELESCNILNTTPYHYLKRVNSSITSRFIPTYYEHIMLKIDKLYGQFEAWDMLTPEALEMLASRYVRYFFSTLQRNMDKRMQMNAAQRKQFFNDELKTERYKKLSPYMGGGGLSGVMAKAFKAKNRFLSLTIAGTINFIKNHFPMLFEKLN